MYTVVQHVPIIKLFFIFLVVVSESRLMAIRVCYGPGNCQQEKTGVVIDYRWTGCNDPRNCRTVSDEFIEKTYSYSHMCFVLISVHSES